MISEKRGELEARTRIQSGFFSGSAATTLMGMRAVFDVALVLDAGGVVGGRRGVVGHGVGGRRVRTRMGASVVAGPLARVIA